MPMNDKFQFTNGLKRGSEEAMLVAMVVASFFNIYAMNKMEPKTIVINQTVPAPVAVKSGDVETAAPKVSTKEEQVKLEVPSTGEKSPNGLVEVPKISLLPTPLNVGGKGDYENLMAETRKSSARHNRNPVVIQRINEGKQDDDGSGVHVVLRSRDSEATATVQREEESEAINVTLGSKEKAVPVKTEAPEYKPKDSPKPEKPKLEEGKKPDSVPVKLQEESSVSKETVKTIAPIAADGQSGGEGKDLEIGSGQ